MRQRSVVVGGCGFIGSRLALSLAAAGDDVAILDRVAPPADLDSLCRVETCDVTDRDSLRGTLDGADSVYLAAALLAKKCDESPELGWAVNVAGTVHALSEILATRRRPRVVFFSSGTVYSSATYPIAEDEPTEAQDVYTASKLAGERIVASAAAAGELRASVLRLFTVYGPGPASGQRGHFVADWLERAVDGRPLRIVGDGSQTVDLTHVDDVVRACRLATVVPMAAGECRIYNVGGGAETRVRDVARWIRDVLPEVSVTTVPPRGNVRARQFGAIARARAELGYEPSVAPKQGIKSLLRQRLEATAPIAHAGVARGT